MIRKLILFFIVLILIILGGIYFRKKYEVVNNISNNLNSAKLELINNNERSIEKVKMLIKEGTLTPSSASIIIVDNNDKPYGYDQWFRIDRRVNEKWEEVNQINNNYIVRDIAYDISKTKKLEIIVK